MEECVLSLLFTNSQGSLRQEHQQQFYREQGPATRNVEVRSGCSIANKLGNNREKGVFSIQDFPAGTRICPYVGEIYARPPKKGKYVMEVSRTLTWMQSMHDPYDVGYLYYLDDSVRGQLRSPPNYGRYINTIYPKDVSLGDYSFNCAFVGDDTGVSFVWVVALVDVVAGTELFVDYGPAYHRHKRGSKSKPRK